ncbi:MAG TPA: hypothetical protein PK307_10655 [Spirochaetota bacterium]|nr:hypothetical protein [Spirochaetota bacterium]
MEQVNNIPENTKRQKIPPPEKFKSYLAGEMGLKLLDSSLLNVMIWCRKAARIRPIAVQLLSAND